MRYFLGGLSIQTSIISWLIEYITKGHQLKLNILGSSLRLSHMASYALTISMCLAGIFIILAKNSTFFTFLAIIIWSFCLFFGLLFVPTYTGIYLRPIISASCLFGALFIYRQDMKQS